MKFNIMEWKSVGLRCPDFNIQINKKGKSLPSFIQMPNGTGKTTYLELIQYSLSGFLQHMEGVDIGKYFHVANPSEQAFFELLVDSGSEKVTFRIDFKFDKEAILNRSSQNKSKVK